MPSSRGLVRVNPRPTEEDIHKYYHDEFYRAGETAEQALAAMQVRAAVMAKHVNRYSRGRLLDIGCFRGEFMEYVRREHGWKVAGIEFSTRPPNLYNLDIFYGKIENAPFEPESFNIVTLWAVLEHVYYPRATIRAVRKLLKPGGSAIILVPNFNSIPARIMHHGRTLQRMLLDEGLTPARWLCSQDVYSGSVRGWLNFLIKRAAGEPMGDIQAQNRSVERWAEFESRIHNRSSYFMWKVDRFDFWMAPKLDRVLDHMGLGFIMIVHAQKQL
jgi:SAM-dependent methyltransferase